MALYELSQQLGFLLQKQQLHCAVAESCTGGLLAATITDVPGSSQWFDRGFVTYTNDSKMELLAVPNAVIAEQGAVSEGTVRAMAEGVLKKSHAQVSAAISGIAGPGGGSIDKPVGTVWVSWALGFEVTKARSYLFDGSRQSIREQAVRVALEGLIELISALDPA